MMSPLATRVLLGFVMLAALPAEGVRAEWTMTATVDGRRIEGRPVAWNDSRVRLIGRDGRLHEFDPRRAQRPRKSVGPLRPLTDRELRGQLYEEFGGRFAFTSTGHYLVVHPTGRGAEWAQRFEDVCRSLLGYLRVRGMAVREPEFPLVAVVLRNRSEYAQLLSAGGADPLPGALGHYDHYSNRVVLYDETGGRGDWEQTAPTIIHEATHQVAFNCGAHTRGADTPYWAPEGLAMLFEPRAVWRPRPSDTRADRVNAERLRDFLHFSRDGAPRFSLAEFVATDRPFRRHGVAAYAQAWALAFYLAETRPREYAAYLEAVAARPPLRKYPATQRVEDFRRAFGRDLSIVEANLMRWAEGLR